MHSPKRDALLHLVAPYVDPDDYKAKHHLAAQGYGVDIRRTYGTGGGRHRHHIYETLVILDGSGVLTVNQTQHVVKKGDLVCLYGESLHGVRPLSGTLTRMAVHVKPDLVADLGLDGQMGSWEGSQVHSIDPDHVDVWAERIGRLRASCGSVAGKQNLREFIHAVAALAQTPLPPPASHPVDDVIDYMLNRPESGEELSSVSQRFYISYPHLIRLFNQELDCTPQRLWRTLRVERACSLLLKDHTVRELARASGFGSRTGFQSAFKRITGMYPDDYRRMLQGAKWQRRSVSELGNE